MKKFILHLTDIAPEIASEERVIEYAKNRMSANPHDVEEDNLTANNLEEAIKVIELFGETVQRFEKNIIASFQTVEDVFNIVEDWTLGTNSNMTDPDTVLHFTNCDITVEQYGKVAGNSYFVESFDDEHDIHIKGVSGTFPEETYDLGTAS